MTWVEWPTLLLVLACYVSWAIGTTVFSTLWLPAGIVLTTLAVAFYSSLQHEIIHGHPFANRRVNEALVFPALTLFIPFLRFRDTHLAHHLDSRLTDPYDDPETNYLDPAIWERLSRLTKAILRFNNTMFGRLLVGPAVAQIVFMKNDWRDIRMGNKVVLTGWFWHIVGLVPVIIWFVFVGSMPIWAILLSAYLGLSILKIRTFLEHQAHERSNGRTVVIEDSGPLAFMFLNNICISFITCTPKHRGICCPRFTHLTAIAI